MSITVSRTVSRTVSFAEIDRYENYAVYGMKITEKLPEVLLSLSFSTGTRLSLLNVDIVTF